MRVLVTGAGGRIGRILRPRLAAPGRVLRLLDAAEQEPAAPGEAVELHTGDLTDAAVTASACAGVDAVLHLAAIATEDAWSELVRVNIDGTRTVLEAAREAGVGRVILASSIHAAGYYSRPGAHPAGRAGAATPMGPDGVPASVPPRPDSYYGVTKATVEALGSLYADRFGMVVVALRIGACFPRPPADHAHMWLSPDDAARLVEACLRTDATGFRVLHGVSANTGRWLSVAEGAEIGYHPVDDSAAYPEGGAPDGPAEELLGGYFTRKPLGRRA
ncbi:MAG TPA: NAD(P)-dependent oxidoreductase [Pilimelia sp.]|nr:NAD(P)-dependent oxidoreductase [Pilimelia sp.]